MATIFSSSPHLLLCRNPLALRSFTLTFPLPLPSLSTLNPPICTPLRAAGAEGGLLGGPSAPDPSILRRPLVSAPPEDEELEEEKGPVVVPRKKSRRKGEDWVDWEDKILEETVPLVGFVRMILHSEKYESGDRLIPEHEKTVTEKLLPYHPEYEKKIGCGIDFITVGYHPEFENSRCMFIMRKDGELIDFSYWKCIKGLIRKNYPLYADSFILRHFRRSRQSD